MWPFTKKTLEEEIEAIGRKISSTSEAEHILSIRKLNRKKRAAWSVWILKCQVENGGFAQYFWNLEDEGFYTEASDGLRIVGAAKHEGLLKRARELIEPHLLVMHSWQGEDDRFTKYKPMLQVTGIYQLFHDLDAQFYDSRPSINEILACYLNVRNEE